MEYSEILHDYNEICGIIPGSIVRSIVGKNSDYDGNLKEYKNITLAKNQKDWLWRAFIKFIMPFQMKTTKDGKRKMSFAGSLYMAFLIIFLFALIFFGFFKYFMILAWVFVIVKVIMPWITAFVKLSVNKNHYKSVLRGGNY